MPSDRSSWGKNELDELTETISRRNDRKEAAVSQDTAYPGQGTSASGQELADGEEETSHAASSPKDSVRRSQP